MDTPKAITVERLFNFTVDKVWKAITDKEEMKLWYFDLADFRAEPGFEFKFSGGSSPERQYLHICEVTEAVSLDKLTYSWRYEGYDGVSFVSFYLNEEESGTRLRLVHQGLESFPQNNPDFASKNFEEGWNYIINTSLKNYLEGESK